MLSTSVGVFQITSLRRARSVIDGVDGGAHGSDRRVLMRGQEPELGAVVKVQKRDKHSKKGKDFAKSPKEKRSSKKEKKEAGHAGSAAEAKQAATGDDKRRSTSPQKLLSRVVSFNARDEKTKDPAERPELARQTSAVRAHTDMHQSPNVILIPPTCLSPYSPYSICHTIFFLVRMLIHRDAAQGRQHRACTPACDRHHGWRLGHTDRH